MSGVESLSRCYVGDLWLDLRMMFPSSKNTHGMGGGVDKVTVQRV